MVYFQSHTVTLRLWSYVWLGDVIKINGQCLYLWQKSQVPSWPYDRRLSIPVARFCGDNKEQRKRISVTGRLVIHSHPGLSTRALKQLGKMKFWEYLWISITVFVLFRTPINIHSWCGNAVEVYKEPPWFSASSPGPTWSAPFYYRQLWFLKETCLLPVRLKKNCQLNNSYIICSKKWIPQGVKWLFINVLSSLQSHRRGKIGKKHNLCLIYCSQSRMALLFSLSLAFFF